jgi:hypothetical protein
MYLGIFGLCSKSGIGSDRSQGSEGWGVETSTFFEICLPRSKVTGQSLT